MDNLLEVSILFRICRPGCVSEDVQYADESNRTEYGVPDGPSIVTLQP